MLDPATWKQRTISVGDGVKIFPFFSADGKSVYFFKGAKRDSGKTPASRYDLYSIALATDDETRLTHEEFYQARRGDDDGDSLIFSATPNYKRSLKDAFGVETRNALFRYRKKDDHIVPVRIDQSIGIFDFYGPSRDKKGHIYFVAAQAKPGGGNYLWFLVRATPDGTSPAALVELPISMGFDIARRTGEIWVMDRLGDELVVRRLGMPADH